MAYKDWEKVDYQNNKWVRKNDSLEIIEEQNGNYSIEVFLFETKTDFSKWLNTRTFRTEKMAVKQAKAYMRSH